MHVGRWNETDQKTIWGTAFPSNGHDQFANGQRFRVHNVVDDVTRECLAAIPDISISGRRVARELTSLTKRRGKPGMIVSDNGTEVTSNAILRWCSEHRIEWHYIAPGKPMRDTVSSKASTGGCATSCSMRQRSAIWHMRAS